MGQHPLSSDVELIHRFKGLYSHVTHVPHITHLVEGPRGSPNGQDTLGPEDMDIARHLSPLTHTWP